MPPPNRIVVGRLLDSLCGLVDNLPPVSPPDSTRTLFREDEIRKCDRVDQIQDEWRQSISGS